MYCLLHRIMKNVCKTNKQTNKKKTHFPLQCILKLLIILGSTAVTSKRFGNVNKFHFFFF